MTAFRYMERMLPEPWCAWVQLSGDSLRELALPLPCALTWGARMARKGGDPVLYIPRPAWHLLETAFGYYRRERSAQAARGWPFVLGAAESATLGAFQRLGARGVTYPALLLVEASGALPALLAAVSGHG